MNWLRLPDFDVSDPRLIHGDHGEVIEVQVDCAPNKFDVDLCCLARKLVKNGNKIVRYRDLKIEAAPTWLQVSRQRYRCQSCDTTLYQRVPHVDDNHMMTSRLREAIELATIKRTFADTVHVLGVEEKLARRVFRAHANDVLLNYRYEAPRVFGVDENMLLGNLRGVIVDVENAKLLDVLPGNNGSEIRRGLDRMDNWDNVEVWCQDMAGGYKGIAKDLFPKATIVVDKFHVLTKANHWFLKVRLSETPKLPVEIRKKMPGMIRLLDRHYESVTDRQKDRIEEVLSHSRRLADAYAIKESFYYWYDAPTREDAESAYKQWVQFVRSKDQMQEWMPLMKMVQRERKFIFSYFDHRWTSGTVERMNRSIGDINRAANGMDFQTLRAKAILRYSTLIPKWKLDMHFMETGAGFLHDVLDDDAGADDVEGDHYFVGSGFDPSTLIADLKAGLF
ncbi:MULTISPECIES: ISL3 family transposase [unclassified Sphingomonas]|uniref:ISL3 family transposase n=1 Tax=unclassified Sphingomonas TaxID=196159 RepID=UPI002269897F|nr:MULTISPECIES: ISL3 family transposase [unclassified Sphingomonas]